MVLNNIGRVYVEQGRLPEAVHQYDDALLIEKQLNSRPAMAITLKNYALALAKQNQPELAITFAKESVNIYQTIRKDNQLMSAQDRRSYAKEIAPTYRTLADLLIQQGRLGEAQRVMGLLRQEETYEFSGQELTRDTETNSIEKLGIEQGWWQQWQALQNKALPVLNEEHELRQKIDNLTLSGKAVPPKDEAQLATLENKKKTIRQATDAYFEQIHRQAGNLKQQLNAEAQVRFDVFKKGIVANLQAMQQRGTQASGVYALSTRDQLYFLIATANGIVPVSIPVGSEKLNKMVAEFRRVLMHPSIDPRPKGKALYDAVFAPVLSQLQATETKHVMWCLDGSLRYIPVAAIWDGDKYLIERDEYFTIFEPLSLDVIAESTRSSQEIAAFAATKGKPPKYKPLPGAESEVNALVSNPGPVIGHVYKNEAFTERVLKAAASRDSISVLHIASHFALGAKLSTSFLLLGDGLELPLDKFSDWGKGQQFGHIDLMSLSACNTAETILDRDEPGAQLDSFVSLAQRDGARAVIASLWPVSDASTPLLMKAFYESWMKAPDKGKGEALRQAQLALLHGDINATNSTITRSLPAGGDNQTGRPFKEDPNKPFAHPYYWASFLLFGNWK